MDNCIILLVAFVLISSYLFKLKWSDASSPQLLYVFLGLLLIVVFKHYYDNRKEGFVNNNNNNTLNNNNNATTESEPANWNHIEAVTADNFTGLKKIIAYLKGLNETDVNREETQKMVADLSTQFNRFDPTKLEHQLAQITTLLNNLQNVSSLTTTPEAKESAKENILESRSIQESQFLQDIEIKKLETELQELEKLYTNFKEKEAKKVYKKIPVYSSCVMEANGTTTKNDAGSVNFETPEQIKKKHQMVTGQLDDPNATPLDKILQTINQGGINISLQGESA